MATVYASPIPAPPFDADYVDGKFSFEKMLEVEAEYIEKVRAWIKEHGYTRKPAGREVSWGYADGAARYICMTYTKLIHLPLGDAWNAPFVQDLNASGVKRALGEL